MPKSHHAKDRASDLVEDVEVLRERVASIRFIAPAEWDKRSVW